MLRRAVLVISAFALLTLCSVILVATAGSRSFVDAAGRDVALPGKVHRVLAAGPPASVLLYALAPEKMVGWVREPSAAEKAFIAEPYRDLPAHGRLTGRGNTANIELVLAQKPDLILDVGTVDPMYASLADRVQEQTGIPYVLIDGSFDRTAGTLRTVAGLLGVEERGEDLAAYAETALGRVRGTLAGIPEDERPRVYYGRGPEGLETGLAGSINTEVLAAVGARNVAEAAGSGGLANVSIEQILSWDPDVVLTLDPEFRRTVVTDPLWAGVRAVKDKRVYRAPTVPFGWFDAPPGINRIIGVYWLMAILYPRIVDIDLKAEASEFYRLFYHVEPTDTQLDELLADAR